MVLMKMKLEDYAWNPHERNVKAKQTEFTPTRPKISIIDDSELRTEIKRAQLDDYLKEDSLIGYGIKPLVILFF